MEVQPEEYSLGMGKVAGSSPVHGSKWATPARRNPVRGIAHSESPGSESSGVTAEERFRLRYHGWHSGDCTCFVSRHPTPGVRIPLRAPKMWRGWPSGIGAPLWKVKQEFNPPSPPQKIGASIPPTRGRERRVQLSRSLRAGRQRGIATVKTGDAGSIPAVCLRRV